MTYPKKQRATKQEDVSEQYGQPAWRYSDGAIRGERGKMIVPLAGQQKFTHETARRAQPLAVAATVERKRAVVNAAANMAVEDKRFVKQFGDMAHVAAIAYAAQQKATNIDDPKMIDAARFVYQEGGHGEQKQAQPADAAVTWRGLLELALRLQPQLPDAVDAEVTEAE